MAPLSEAEDRAVAKVKMNRPGGWLKLKPLPRLTGLVHDSYLPGPLRNAYFEFAPSHGVIGILQ
jgi:hypothetical protein